MVDQIVRRHWLYVQQRGAGSASCSDIKGFTNGFRGLVDGTFVALNPQLTETWPRRGGSMLRQLREDPTTRPAAAKVVETLRRFAIDVLYVAGGDGSLQSAREIKGLLDAQGLNIAVVHIPKTMDNDIPWVSESFGFQTAIAEAARLVNALRDEAESNNRIGVVEVMGAGVGHTAACTALASGEVDAVLIPEQGPLNIDLILDHLDRRALGRGRKGYAVILAAEKTKLDLDSLVARLFGEPAGGPLPDDPDPVAGVRQQAQTLHSRGGGQLPGSVVLPPACQLRRGLCAGRIHGLQHKQVARSVRHGPVHPDGRIQEALAAERDGLETGHEPNGPARAFSGCALTTFWCTPRDSKCSCTLGNVRSRRMLLPTPALICGTGTGTQVRLRFERREGKDRESRASIPTAAIESDGER